VRPDSTVGDNALRGHAVATVSVQESPPPETVNVAEETETLSLNDVPLSERVRMINVSDIVTPKEGYSDGSKPEVKVDPVPAIIVSLPSADDLSFI